MSKPDLDAIEARANARRKYADERDLRDHDHEEYAGLADESAADVPYLIAEVRRLRDDLDAAAYRAGVAQGRIGQLQAQIERVRELHQRVETRSHYPMPPNWEHQKLVVCGHCKHAGDAAHPYPCPTIEALGGDGE